jgi:hypothetical protein
VASRSDRLGLLPQGVARPGLGMSPTVNQELARMRQRLSTVEAQLELTTRSLAAVNKAVGELRRDQAASAPRLNPAGSSPPAVARPSRANR